MCTIANKSNIAECPPRLDLHQQTAMYKTFIKKGVDIIASSGSGERGEIYTKSRPSVLDNCRQSYRRLFD